MKMTAAELRLILDNHRKWPNGEDGGSRAVLTGADLTRADLARRWKRKPLFPKETAK